MGGSYVPRSDLFPPIQKGKYMSKKISIKKMLKDFDVANEDELYTKLTENPDTIPCIICGKEIPIDEIKTINDDPYCKKCRNNL